MKPSVGGFFKIPSTRGGKIRLLGLLGYSVATVLYPPLGALLASIVKVVALTASGQ